MPVPFRQGSRPLVRWLVSDEVEQARAASFRRYAVHIDWSHHFDDLQTDADSALRHPNRL